MTEGQRDTPTVVNKSGISGPAPSGERDLYSDGLESGAWPTVARSDAAEAYAEMLRAVDRGVCVIVADVVASDGFRLQWSAWRSGGELHFQAWHFTVKRGWSRGPTFVVSRNSFPKLSELLTL